MQRVGLLIDGMVATAQRSGVWWAATGGRALATSTSPPVCRVPPRSGDHPASSATACKHVVEITFDNVHFFRDNPNVPSDLEMMPHLLDFIEKQRRRSSPTTTPRSSPTPPTTSSPPTPASTATARACRSPTVTRPTTPTARPTRPARSPTGPTRSSTPPQRPTPATTPTRRWSTRPSRRRRPSPALAPTRSHRRRGCRSPGRAATSATWRPPTWSSRTRRSTSRRCSAPSSPEAQQLAADPDSFKDAETADYVGVAVHCAQGQRLLRRRHRGEVRSDHALADGGRRPAARTSPAATTASRRSSATATSLRSSVPARPT